MTSRQVDKMGYEVKLGVFEGPIELLLHLITRQRVDIYEVSLATITEEYLAVMASLEDLDLEAATGFLVVAATLLELKSVRLLPSSAGSESDTHLLEERDVLLARLVECATFRNAGAHMAVALQRGEHYHGRSAALESRFVDLAPDPLAALRCDDVVTAAARVFAPRPSRPLDTSHIAPIRASVRAAIIGVGERLRRAGALSFSELCAGEVERVEIVVRFLALLELFKAGAIGLSQAERFGEIRACWTGEVDTQEVLLDAEEYAVETGGAEPRGRDFGAALEQAQVGNQ